MTEGSKRVDVRLGNFACTINGFNEPGPVLAAVIATLREAQAAGPLPEMGDGGLDESAATRLLEEAAEASGLSTAELEVSRGILVTTRAAAEGATADAPSLWDTRARSETEEPAPRLDAAASAEIKRVLEEAARLPAAPVNPAALARERFGRRERDLEPAPQEPVEDVEAPTMDAADLTDLTLPEATPEPIEPVEPIEPAHAEDVLTLDPLPEETAVPEAPAAVEADDLTSPEVLEPISAEAETLEPEPEPEAEPDPVTLSEEVVEEPVVAPDAPAPAPEEEEPLVLNIFDAPPPRSAPQARDETWGEARGGPGGRQSGFEAPASVFEPAPPPNAPTGSGGPAQALRHLGTGLASLRARREPEADRLHLVEEAANEVAEPAPVPVSAPVSASLTDPAMQPEPALAEAATGALSAASHHTPAEAPAESGALHSAPAAEMPGPGPAPDTAPGSEEPAPVALLRPLAAAASAPSEDHQPRRTSRGGSWGSRDVAKPREREPQRPGEGAPASAQALAWRMDARTPGEQILCAAAWLTFAENKPRFSRRDAFAVVDAIPGEQVRNLEIRVKGFGRLVRDGAIIQLGADIFALSERELDRVAPFFD